MKAMGPKSELKTRKQDFSILFGNVRSIYWFNRFVVYKCVILCFDTVGSASGTASSRS